MGKAILFISGFLVLILGIALILRHWDASIIVFKGVVPPLIAIAGLVLMFAATLRK